MSFVSARRFPLLAASCFGLAGVALGALGAHKLEPLLMERGMTHAWETGARYHLVHAVALLALAALARGANAKSSRWLQIAAWCWSIGIVLFSGSLYWIALRGPQPYAVVFATPLGGLAFIAGWACLIVTAFAQSSEPSVKP